MAKGKKGFQAGHSGFKKPGTKTKYLTDWSAFGEHLLTVGLEKAQQELMQLEGDKFLNNYIRLLAYFRPTLSSVAMEGDNTPKSLTVVILNTQEELKKFNTQAAKKLMADNADQA